MPLEAHTHTHTNTSGRASLLHGLHLVIDVNNCAVLVMFPQNFVTDTHFGTFITLLGLSSVGHRLSH